jgi:hypothetical protein
MRKRTAALAVVGTVVLGAGALAYAEEQPADPTTAEGPRRHGPGLHIPHRAIHADFLVPGDADGTWKTVTFDRGEVVSVSATSITLHRPDGVEVSKTISETTTFRGVAGPEEVRVGGRALVKSEGDAALTVAQPKHDRPERAGQRRRIAGARQSVDESGSVDGGEVQVPAA